MAQALVHPHRKEIARYLLSRGVDADIPTPSETIRAAKKLSFPDGLAPEPLPIDPVPASTDAMPAADIVVVTWTADEVAALADVLSPGFSPAVPHTKAQAKTHWYPYDRNFATYEPKIRPGAPAATSRLLAQYFPVQVGTKTVLLVKSALHLNQDGVKTGDGTATLPVKDFFQQIISESSPSHIFTTGTAGSVFDKFGLGDVVVTRAAKFHCSQEFRNEPFNHRTYKSHWTIPTDFFDTAETMMETFTPDLSQPPVGPPTKEFKFEGPLLAPPSTATAIRLDGRDMRAFHPILTTDYFEYGTSANRLDKAGSGVEMGDAALGLACSELRHPPKWAVVRNMSDPVINGDLPAKTFHLNEQTTWAVGYYTAYGLYTSKMSALAVWAIIAGL